jgi:hypothetical protein
MTHIHVCFDFSQKSCGASSGLYHIDKNTNIMEVDRKQGKISGAGRGYVSAVNFSGYPLYFNFRRRHYERQQTNQIFCVVSCNHYSCRVCKCIAGVGRKISRKKYYSCLFLIVNFARFYTINTLNARKSQ